MICIGEFLSTLLVQRHLNVVASDLIHKHDSWGIKLAMKVNNNKRSHTFMFPIDIRHIFYLSVLSYENYSIL